MTGLEFKTSIKIYCLSHKIDIDSIGYLCCEKDKKLLYGVWNEEIKELVFIPIWAEELDDFTREYSYKNFLQIMNETPDGIEVKFTTYNCDVVNPKKFKTSVAAVSGLIALYISEEED